MAKRQRSMEKMVGVDPSFWKDRSVFITGHTGFKGGWLSLWLKQLGAHVHGYALDPPTNPNLFETAEIPKTLKTDTRADIRNLESLKINLSSLQPEVVFHLAAQPLVQIGYQHPLMTLETNIMGTANLLEAISTVDSVHTVVVITTDKVYENREWVYAYREIDPLGGYDPYSASKAAAEIVIASYRSSFFKGNENPNKVRLAAARAGNVLGGGDWGNYRLVPDCLSAFDKGEALTLRYPNAVRPWQHVFEPLYGYLLLAERLSGSEGDKYATAWNFGPDLSGDATAVQIAQTIATLLGRTAEIKQETDLLHEAQLLRLDSTQARIDLGWNPKWTLSQALRATVDWHLAWKNGENMHKKSMEQLKEYME